MIILINFGTLLGWDAYLLKVFTLLRVCLIWDEKFYGLTSCVKLHMKLIHVNFFSIFTFLPNTH